MLDSPFKFMLNTNIVPESQDGAAIRAYLETPRRDLAELDAQLERLQELVQATQRKRKELHAAIYAHEALISPMRRVPDDVLRAIFVCTLPENRNTAMVAEEGPLLLMRVCKHWQALELVNKRAALWIERSGAVPLSFTLTNSRVRLFRAPSGSNQDPEDAEVQPLLSLLLGVAGRWRSIRLALTRRADLHAVQQLTSEDAPLLESLGLSCSRLVDEAEVDDEAIYSFQLAEAPTLRRLGYSGSYESLPKNVNWSNLVFLKLHLWTDSEINTPTPIIPSPFHFLRDAAGLEVLDLSISRYETRFDPIDPIHLPQLTKLRISLHGLNEQEDISGTIRQFDMPQLRTLDFLLAAATKLTDVVAPLPRLTSLSISLQLYPSMDLAAGLALIPHLERLRILGEPVLSGAPDNEAMETDSLFLERFIPRTDAGADAPAPLCPALHTFEYLFVNQVTDALVVRFLKSRTSPLPAPDPGITVARLKRFYFYPFREAQLDITAALASALADGLVMGLGHRQSSRASYSVLEGTEHDPARSKNGVGHEWLQHEEFNEDFRLVGGWVAGL